MITQKQYDDLLEICENEESEDRASDDLIMEVEYLIEEVDETKLNEDQKKAFKDINDFFNARDLYAGIHWEFQKLIEPSQDTGIKDHG